MHPSTSMARVVDGKRYSVATATLLASNEFWDGSNWERSGRNTHLYRTPRGAFFAVHTTRWQGERETLEPLSVDDARALYEALPEQEVCWGDAFGAPPEEA